MAEIIWLTKAVDELNASLEFIALDNQKAAENLASKITEKIERLGVFPLSGKKPKENLNTDYHEIVIKPFRIFYLFDERKDTVFITDFYSSRQDIFSHLSEQNIELITD